MLWYDDTFLTLWKVEGTLMTRFGVPFSPVPPPQDDCSGDYKVMLLTVAHCDQCTSNVIHQHRRSWTAMTILVSSRRSRLSLFNVLLCKACGTGWTLSADVLLHVVYFLYVHADYWASYTPFTKHCTLWATTLSPQDDTSGDYERILLVIVRC